MTVKGIIELLLNSVRQRNSSFFILSDVKKVWGCSQKSHVDCTVVNPWSPLVRERSLGEFVDDHVHVVVSVLRLYWVDQPNRMVVDALNSCPGELVDEHGRAPCGELFNTFNQKGGCRRSEFFSRSWCHHERRYADNSARPCVNAIMLHQFLSDGGVWKRGVHTTRPVQQPKRPLGPCSTDETPVDGCQMWSAPSVGGW